MCCAETEKQKDWERERIIERFGVECIQRERESEMEVDRGREKCNWMQTEKQSRGVKYQRSVL